MGDWWVGGWLLMGDLWVGGWLLMGVIVDW